MPWFDVPAKWYPSRSAALWFRVRREVAETWAYTVDGWGIVYLAGVGGAMVSGAVMVYAVDDVLRRPEVAAIYCPEARPSALDLTLHQWAYPYPKESPR